ncbi:hypothetical protein [Aestuariivirga sp.]|uniref:hypothetical protein n=1 Tax=Aestuariivirga sp. TaxID=2650926 RepID=UPI0039E4E9E1
MAATKLRKNALAAPQHRASTAAKLKIAAAVIALLTALAKLFSILVPWMKEWN